VVTPRGCTGWQQTAVRRRRSGPAHCRGVCRVRTARARRPRSGAESCPRISRMRRFRRRRTRTHCHAASGYGGTSRRRVRLGSAWIPATWLRARSGPPPHWSRTPRRRRVPKKQWRRPGTRTRWKPPIRCKPLKLGKLPSRNSCCTPRRRGQQRIRRHPRIGRQPRIRPEPRIGRQPRIKPPLMLSPPRLHHRTQASRESPRRRGSRAAHGPPEGPGAGSLPGSSRSGRWSARSSQ